MTGKSQTASFILLIILLITGYDIYAAVYLPHGSTITRVLYAASSEYPIIAFVLGILAGHLFWSWRRDTDKD